jgi:hypothetical protein
VSGLKYVDNLFVDMDKEKLELNKKAGVKSIRLLIEDLVYWISCSLKNGARPFLADLVHECTYRILVSVPLK